MRGALSRSPWASRHGLPALLAAASIAWSAGCGPRGHEPEGPGKPDASVGPDAGKDNDVTTQALFDSAVQSYGPAYVEAERKLRAGGTATEVVLRANLHHADPVARKIARVALDWLEGSAADYQAALDYLDSLPALDALTAAGVPSPLGAAGYLSMHFGAKVVDLLAVRVLKGNDWPHWRVAGVLFYLKEQARPSATEPLLRFAVETKNDEWRGWAIEAIAASKDPDLKNRLDAERRRTQALALPFPAALAALTPAKAP